MGPERYQGPENMDQQGLEQLPRLDASAYHEAVRKVLLNSEDTQVMAD